ncbi:high affinity cAMP-specific and IBMX-insensitive 3',5'-cyclic phosphodiesterase 8B-like isoform X6 [Mytilus galloprovincialis]|uniref:high affinity cAMP-specific and IBMX-insensitive 3',5'-cyclic phosphodiesterase 8B-like isoform X6 n=1 Tax=Mytilus galloprovincialis TaxID=29158 RepID=UPI003F7CAC4D
MGCTPSIHVNQTGLVICRESEDSNSHIASYSAAYHTRVVKSDGTTETSSGVAVTSLDKQSAFKELVPLTLKQGNESLNIEAQTQTSIRIEMKSTNNEVSLGPMKLKQKTMSILLVFAKEDAQSDGFWWAADKIGYKCYIAHNPETAMENYLDKHPDVVIIDHRNSKHFDAEALCRSLRATESSEHTVIVAVTKRYALDKEEPSFLPSITAGFNKRIVESPNISMCMNELLTLEYGEVQSRLKLSACKAVFSALDNVSDAVEISSEDLEVQYVNHAFERLTGYSSEEVLGKNSSEIVKNDRNRPDLNDTINSQLKKGKYWDGIYHTRRKSGEILPSHCHICPVLGQGGKISHVISIKNSTTDTSHILKESTEFNLVNGRLSRQSSGLHGVPRRKESIARIHSMTIEAPITKVINIINAAQESSPITVVQALDKVLEILRTSELYSPYFAQQNMKDNDPMTSDLVSGLVSQNVKRSLTPSYLSDVNSNSSGKQGHHSHLHIPSPVTSSLSQVPDHIQEILDKDYTWEFNVIELEKVTNKRPLLYLGLKTLTRFGICDFFQVEESVIANWLKLVEGRYHSTNTYHNSTHAADVMHASAYFLERERNKAVFDQMDEIACLIAAIVHDLDHPGRTNAFLVNEKNQLAILYNDQAVLENHHSALAFQLTWKDDSVNIFKNLETDDYKILRQNIIDMVLATEMKQHFQHLNKFINSINKGCLKMDETSSMSGNGSPDSTMMLNQLSAPENKTFIKRILIKCADVANPCRPLDVCKEWGKRIAEEYFLQTDEEKARGLPVVMPVFDRKSIRIPKSQLSFIDVFINEMFESFDDYCDIPELISHLQTNYQYWKERDEESSEKSEQENLPNGTTEDDT